MNENTFLVVIFTIIATIILGIGLFISLYWIDHNKKIVALIEKGVDPVAVMCAMQDDYGTNPVCLVLAAKK